MNRTVADILAAALILLFVYTAVSKLVDFGVFAEQMNNQPLPSSLTVILTYAVPSMEIGVAFLLIFRRVRMYGFLFSFILMLNFTVYVGLIISHAFSYIPCSCAGIFTSMSWPFHLFVNILFTLFSIAGFFIERSSLKKHIKLYRD